MVQYLQSRVSYKNYFIVIDDSNSTRFKDMYCKAMSEANARQQFLQRISEKL